MNELGFTDLELKIISRQLLEDACRDRCALKFFEKYNNCDECSYLQHLNDIENKISTHLKNKLKNKQK